MTDWDGTGYERISELQRHLAQVTLSALDLRGDERVLDVGCGDGYITRSIAARLPHGSVIGVDASPRMIEAARSHTDPVGSDVRFEVGNALTLPYESEFDVVVSFNALHWVVDQIAVLTAIARALRPGGRTIVQQVCGGPRRSLESTAMIVCASSRWSRTFTGFAAPFVHVDPARYAGLAAAAGLRMTDQRVDDIRWDFGSRRAFVDWCTVGFADWTVRLAGPESAQWVDDVVDAYKAQIGEPGVIRFLQMRAEMTRADDLGPPGAAPRLGAAAPTRNPGGALSASTTEADTRPEHSRRRGRS
ncbi:MAG TPA: class I SAM-dependent methyltransferase [Nakamurella sp.]